MTSSERTPGAGQAPNMWEELNRPRASHRHVSPPPPPTAAAATVDPTSGDARDDGGQSGNDGVSDVAAQLHEASAQAKETLARIDPQYVLLAAAGIFVVVTAMLLSGLGGSSGTETTTALVAHSGEPAAPESLAVVDEPAAIDEVAAPEPIAEPAVVPPPLPTAPPTPMAMGLPAELLDSAQSQVFRLYRTALGREPDRDGFAFWSDQVRSGVPLERLAREFLASDEYVAQFGGDSAWEARAEQLLANAFGPASNAEERDARRERFRGLEGEALLVAISEADETLDATGTLR